MSLVVWIRETGWVAWVQIVLLLGGLAWSVVCAALLGMRWRVPAIVACAPLVATPLVGAVAGSFAGRTLDGVIRSADPAQRAVLMAAGTAEILHGAVMLAVVVPSAMILGLGAAAGGVRPPRGWGAPVVAFLLTALLAILPFADLFYNASAGGVVLRVLLYGLGVIPVTMSMVNNGMQTNGKEASATAGFALFSLVTATELAVDSTAWIDVFSAIANADPSSKATILQGAAAEIGARGWLGNVRIGLSLAVLLLGVFRGVAQPTEEEILAGNFNPSPARTLASVATLAGPLFWIMAILALDPSGTMAKLTAFYLK